MVPDFVVDEGKTSEWTPLTQGNADYEQLWSAPAWNPPPPAEPEKKPGKRTGIAKSEHSVENETVVDTPGFKGTLVTGNEVLQGSIVIGPDQIVLWGGGHELGSWTHQQAKIARLTFARFAIQVEGDTLTFTAADPTALDHAISEAVLFPTSDLPPAAPAPAEASPVDAVPPPVAAAAPVVEMPIPVAEQPVTSTEKPAPLPEETVLQADDQATTPEEPLSVAREPAPPGRRARIKGFQITPAERATAAAEDAATEVSEPEPDISIPAEEQFGTIADNVRSKSPVRTVKARRFLATPQGVLIKVGVALVVASVIAGLFFVVLLVSGRLDEGEAPATTLATPDTTAVRVVITTAPPPTVTTTLPPPMSTLFETDAAVLTERWNTLAETSEAPLLLPSELPTPFFLILAPNITLEGVLDPAAGNVTLRGTPTGTPEGDGPIITALGLLIATADPTLDGGDRRALLMQLGLDVNDPELAGLDSSLTYNSLLYRLVYDQASNTLSLIVTPETASTTTTG